jgi:hypothetical protein
MDFNIEDSDEVMAPARPPPAERRVIPGAGVFWVRVPPDRDLRGAHEVKGAMTEDDDDSDDAALTNDFHRAMHGCRQRLADALGSLCGTQRARVATLSSQFHALWRTYDAPALEASMVCTNLRTAVNSANEDLRSARETHECLGPEPLPTDESEAAVAWRVSASLVRAAELVEESATALEPEAEARYVEVVRRLYDMTIEHAQALSTILVSLPGFDITRYRENDEFGCADQVDAWASEQHEEHLQRCPHSPIGGGQPSSTRVAWPPDPPKKWKYGDPWDPSEWVAGVTNYINDLNECFTYINRTTRTLHAYNMPLPARDVERFDSAWDAACAQLTPRLESAMDEYEASLSVGWRRIALAHGPSPLMVYTTNALVALYDNVGPPARTLFAKLESARLQCIATHPDSASDFMPDPAELQGAEPLELEPTPPW